uniref:Large ribosomal subunit protein uL18c n=1 Tax=Campylaephora sungminbooi TaxID=1896769 RepID=A0A1B0RRM9_9FLOR|nr:50S ribosomal protein L18 [Campylaephora sungminbooi]AKU47409.1 50S ribosomal protein L18 [Campylaephora sungminbooi]ALN11856.1 50S ribosomal protein L18 [Campylaephora sungminbooi]
MIKKKIRGTEDYPRLYIFKSNKHLYAQLIDDYNKHIIATSSTISPEITNNQTLFRTCKTAQLIGKNIAIKSKAKGIQKVVFDRGNNLYHGQIKALADAVREEGIYL